MTNYKPPAIVRLAISMGAAFAVIAIIKRTALDGTHSIKELGASPIVALVLGVGLLVFAIAGLLRLASSHAPGRVVAPGEEAGSTLELGRPRLYGWLVPAAMGLSLVLLSVASPAGALSTGAALSAVLVLLVSATALTFLTWRHLDELSRTMAREAGSTAFYLTVVIGGGWATLAHLGFVAEPEPLHWLTMLTVFMFAASFIAVSRRNLLSHS